ncbi:MAG: diguanylate cyclase, partial [Gammaproteobacteria bacterium]|nr:diguanylate cyclase [Gammaproteobacteria bacterium]
MKVLLAEDIRSNQMLIQAYVEEAGHHVVVVGDGQQAIDAFIKERPDLVILDVIMPIKNGLEVAEEIHKIIDIDHDWVPIIFLSGMIDSADIARGIDAGGDDYLIKPIDATVLNAKLRAMQRIAEMRQQLHQANRKLKMMSVKDGLTGLSNRRHFDETLERELKRAIRTSTAVSLVLCDIDHFKSFNDNYGHQSGDDCLK